jgi:hypothetical protein
MAVTTGGSDTATRDAFLDVVCRDEELLRAEFEAIIGASWPGSSEPPASPPPAPPGPADRQPPGPERPDWPAPSTRAARLPVPPRLWRGRQRSPPALEGR